MRRVRASFLKKLNPDSFRETQSWSHSPVVRWSRGLVLQWFLALVSALSLLAQPANDNFADAEDVTGLNGGLFGSVTNDLSSATAEPGEPNHAGFPANATIWYRWTAPQNGEVQLDTLSSPFGSDTVLAVYTGNTLTTLRQIAANDDLFPIAQQNEF